MTFFTSNIHIQGNIGVLLKYLCKPELFLGVSLVGCLQSNIRTSSFLPLYVSGLERLFYNLALGTSRFGLNELVGTNPG